jgi:NifU-like protein involved in Fe-S cluster formation
MNADLESKLSLHISTIPFSERVKKTLLNGNIATVRDLVQTSPSYLRTLRQFGQNSLEEVRSALMGMGLSLGMKIDDRQRIEHIAYQEHNRIVSQLRASIDHLNNTIKSLQTDKTELYRDLDKLRATANDAEQKLNDIAETKDVEDKLASTVTAAEKIAASVSDPSLRPTAYAFALQTIYATSRPGMMRIPMGMPMFLGM